MAGADKATRAQGLLITVYCKTHPQSRHCMAHTLYFHYFQFYTNICCAICFVISIVCRCLKNSERDTTKNVCICGCTLNIFSLSLFSSLSLSLSFLLSSNQMVLAFVIYGQVG